MSDSVPLHPFKFPDGLSDEIAGLHGPIAVIGAGGFIGAAMLRSLLSYRKDCYGITQQVFVPWRLVGLPTTNIVTCDIRDPEAVARLLGRFKFKTIFFFAAYGAYARQTESRQIYDTNVLGLLNVIEAAEDGGLSALVHAGSSSEYGLNCAAPSEDAPLEPNSHYSVSKIAAANLVRYKGTVGGLPTINLRLYSVYGPYEEQDRLVPRLVTSALGGTYPALVDPGDLARLRLHQRRHRGLHRRGDPRREARVGALDQRLFRKEDDNPWDRRRPRRTRSRYRANRLGAR